MSQTDTTVYIAKITCTSGWFEDRVFSSDYCAKLEDAVLDLQTKVHEGGGTADWDNVTIYTFTITSTTTVSAHTILPNKAG
jgi:hypothetical protein